MQASPGPFDLAPSEAEPIKLSLSLAEPSIRRAYERAGREGSRGGCPAAAHLRPRARLLAQFYQSQPGSLGIGEIVPTGGTAHLPGFAAELAKLIGVRVRVGDPLANVKTGKKDVDRDLLLGSLAAAIGLGIDG